MSWAKYNAPGSYNRAQRAEQVDHIFETKGAQYEKTITVTREELNKLFSSQEEYAFRDGRADAVGDMRAALANLWNS